MSKTWKIPAEVQEGIRLAFDALRSNKFRSGMTILGVMIGIGAVIIVNTIMEGFIKYTEASIDKIGSNVIYVTKWGDDTDFDNMTDEERRRKDMTMDEALAIRDMCPLIKAVSPEKKAFRNVAKYMGREIRSPDDFRGCWPEQAIVTNRDVSHGRFIDDNDMRRAAKVCVIGPAVADALFDHREDAIEKEIKVNGYPFTVIGVQEEIDDFFGISENDFIYIPMTTFDQFYPNTKRVYLLASAISRDMFGEAMDQVINALRRVRRLRPEEPNNFGFRTQEYFKNAVNNIMGTIHMVAVAVACVGLMVGVIGVLNIMLISVTQRTREIGIRKALGARRKNILFQFLVEAGTLTGVGGLIGILFGALVGLVITASLGWHYHLSFIWTIAGLAVSVGTGMTAGVYPAWRASRVDPIIALHYE
ncbi:MAG: ABC transporter permease [candidate division Zixibacteria bacterium]